MENAFYIVLISILFYFGNVFTNDFMSHKIIWFFIPLILRLKWYFHIAQNLARDAFNQCTWRPEHQMCSNKVLIRVWHHFELKKYSNNFTFTQRTWSVAAVYSFKMIYWEINMDKTTMWDFNSMYISDAKGIVIAKLDCIVIALTDVDGGNESY